MITAPVADDAVAETRTAALAKEVAALRARLGKLARAQDPGLAGRLQRLQEAVRELPAASEEATEAPPAEADGAEDGAASEPLESEREPAAAEDAAEDAAESPPSESPAHSSPEGAEAEQP